MNKLTIGLGGGCHWCTEGVFKSVKGVVAVKQGWISSESPNQEGSEAVLIHYDMDLIKLPLLIAIHLHSHSCTSNHVFRKNTGQLYMYSMVDKKRKVCQLLK